jgi:hypothetical protein
MHAEEDVLEEIVGGGRWYATADDVPVDGRAKAMHELLEGRAVASDVTRQQLTLVTG